MRLALALALIAVCGSAVVARADTNVIVPMQGYVTDANGNPLQNDVSMAFALFPDSVTPTPLWTETQTVNISSGLFTAYLGSSTPISASLFRSNPAGYVQVTVGTDSPMARWPLGSSPTAGFAALAGDAQTIQGQSLSSISTSAASSTYSGMTSGLADTTVQGAIDDLASQVKTLQSALTALQLDESTRLTALETAKTADEATITGLQTARTADEANIAALQTANTANQANITTLQTDQMSDATQLGTLSGGNVVSRLTALETKTASLTTGKDLSSNPSVYFTGVNVYVQSGAGETGAAPNGLGNLILGYNELRGDVSDERSGSHNLIVGTENSYSSYGGLVVGAHNGVDAVYGAVTGGTTLDLTTPNGSLDANDATYAAEIAALSPVNVAGLQTALNNEIAARQTGDAATLASAESYTQTSVGTETLERTTADTTINGSLTTLGENLMTETSNRIAGDAATLSSAESFATSAVGNEESIRVGAVTTLTNNLATETSNRIAGDAATLSTAENAASGALGTETTLRIDGDVSTLATAETFATNAVNNEATARAAAEASNLATAEADTSNAIAGEATLRTTGDANTLTTAENYAEAAVQTETSARQAVETTLGASVTKLQTKTGSMSAAVDGEGYPSVFFTGVNVYIQDGSTATADVSGLGNLILGYNEQPTGNTPPVEKTGSHNLILGAFNSYTSFSSIVSGTSNQSNGSNEIVAGGTNNTATSDGAAVLGGSENENDGAEAGILGGANDDVDENSNDAALVAGQSNFSASVAYGFVGGGKGQPAR